MKKLELKPHIIKRQNLTTELGQQHLQNLIKILSTSHEYLTSNIESSRECQESDVIKLERYHDPIIKTIQEFIDFLAFIEPEKQVNDLTLTAKVLSANYSASTAQFKEVQNSQDGKVWATCKNLLSSPDSYVKSSKTKSELNRATANVVQLIEQSDKRSRYRIFELSQRIKGNSFPFSNLEPHVKQELFDLAKITHLHYENLQDYFE